MPTVSDIPIGAPCWIDLFTSDPDRAVAFYGELFGWTAASAGEEYGGYINFSQGRSAGGRRHEERRRAGHARHVVGLPRRADDAKATVDAAARTAAR